MTREEAIKILRDIHDKSLFSVRNALETLIPELAENEDERIRKAIICGMNALKGQKMETFAGIPINDCLAWLEKQKEHRPAEWSEEDEKRVKQLIYDTEFIKAHYEKRKGELGEQFNNALIRDCDEQINWLKSLRPSWKPSKKQMDALWTAKSYYGRAWACDIQRSLESLYGDLEEQMK